MLRPALIGMMLTACTTGGTQRVEPTLTATPRLITTYILATVQSSIVDFEAIREYTCEPSRNLVALCQRAERVRTSLQFAQSQLTRVLGDVPDSQQLIVPMPGSR